MPTLTGDNGVFAIGASANTIGTVNVGRDPSGALDGNGFLKTDSLIVGEYGTGTLNASGANTLVTVQSGKRRGG